ncbi:MAG: gluconate kinase [Actinomyces sp.]|nr:MAG: gluconate kinase [Actinomyces sp.]
MGTPTSASRAGIAESHVSTVFFTADRAYKLLKPVDLGFLDHTDRATRLQAAFRELELNRRLAPDVYLGLADVVEGGVLTDRFIVMRRLPEEAKLPNLVGTEHFEPALRAIARAVAAFHAGQPPLHDAPMARRDAVLANWEDNLSTLRRFEDQGVPAVELDRAASLWRAYLEPRETLFDKRIEEGWVRDGHGDLIAEDIFVLEDGPRILDCLAFRDDLRIADVLADIAFLVMDVHRLADAGAAERLMRWYREFSAEHHPSSLAHHYVAYRAHVRAKVACLQAASSPSDPGPSGAGRSDPGGSGDLWALARRYHDLTVHHLERARVRAVLLGGAPGSGKTTVADALSDRLGWVPLTSDAVRRDLAGLDHVTRSGAELDAGLYSEAMTERTYERLVAEGAELVRLGESVVLDASWTQAAWRERARRALKAAGALVLEVECTVSDEEAARRVARRWHEPGPEDVTPEMVGELRRRRDRWPEAWRLDTERPLDEVIEAAVTALAAAG